MGLLAAVEMWMKKDHKRIMALWTSRCEFIARKLGYDRYGKCHVPIFKLIHEYPSCH